KRAALDRVIDLLSIDPELAGEFGRGPPGTLEFGEQVWRLLSQHLDDCVPLPAFLAPQLHDGEIKSFSPSGRRRRLVYVDDLRDWLLRHCAVAPTSSCARSQR